MRLHSCNMARPLSGCAIFIWGLERFGARKGEGDSLQAIQPSQQINFAQSYPDLQTY